MKRLFAVGAVLLALAIAGLTAQPAPPSITIPAVSTNVLTNVTVSLPVGTFNNGIVYAAARSLTNASVQVVWSPNTELDLAGYELVYGDAKAGSTNVLATAKNTNVVLFTLNTNTTYYFYAVAINTANQRSAPSNVVIYQPDR